jgi:hypothetical protein
MKIKEFFGEVVLGLICLFGGLAVGSFVLMASGWDNLYFYYSISLIYAWILIYKFYKPFEKYWNRNKH